MSDDGYKPSDAIKRLWEKLNPGVPMPTYQETIADAEAMYEAGICNPIMHSYAEMRCSSCGKTAPTCDCPRDEIRVMTCPHCGLRIGTGGLSLSEIITANEPKPS